MMKKKLFYLLLVMTLIGPAALFAQEDQPGSPVDTSSNTVGRVPAAQNEAPAQQQAKPSAEGHISLDIKGMDIVDVLKMLSERSGLNIVVGKNVTGRVTLFLKDVPVWDAFEIVLLSNELAYDKKGDIVNVMTQRDYELLYGERYEDKKQIRVMKLQYAKAADISRALNQIKTNLGRIVADEGSNTIVLIDMPETLQGMVDFVQKTDSPIETRIFSLNYATAEKLSPKLQEAVTKGVGSIKIDERTNKVIVTDYPDRINEIARIITAFDEKPMQVLIDAQILEVKPSDQFQMGVNWEYFIKKNFDLKTTLPLTTQSVLSVGAAAGPAGIASAIVAGQYKGVIDILRTVGEVNVLSSPRIMVLNNQEAKIHIGRRDAYITSTTSQSGTGTAITSQSVNFVDIGIQLRVTPTINKDGFVTMKIKPEVSDAVAKLVKSQDQDTEVPIVSTSESETTVVVKDGVTIIIGGLAQDKKAKTVKKIPVLGDIPFLGMLFRSTDERIEKDELVILLTPHIMSGEKSYVDFSQIPPLEGAVAKMEKGKIVTQKFSAPQQSQSLSELNPQGNIASSYYRELVNSISRRAGSYPAIPEKGQVTLVFKLSADGKLLNEPTVVSASSPTLASLAVNTVKDASNFPPLPKELGKSEETFRVNLEYN